MPHRPRFAPLLFAVVFLIPGGMPAEARDARQPDPQPAVSAADLAQRIHKLVNAERIKHDLPALAWDAALARIALNHSRDMAHRNYLSHDSPEGHDFGARYRQAGYTCQIQIGHVVHTGAENIALGRLYNSVTRKNGIDDYDWNSPQKIARLIVDGWMDSPGHRENILTPHWRHQGIGVEIGPGNQIYITQNFC